VSKRNDISQLIRKYHNGELDARAMHQLEKEAQNDPFLMEALEGYEQSAAGQQQNLADVYQRLHDRTHKTERRIIPWRLISIAASILIVLTIGGLLLRNQSPETNKILVKLSKPKQAPQITKPATIDTVENIIHQSSTTKLIASNKPHKISRHVETIVPDVSANAAPAANDMVAVVPNQYKKDTASLNEVVVVGYGTQKKSAITQSAQTVSANEAAKSKGYSNAELADISTSTQTGNKVTGIVKDDGSPLPGVMVRIKGTSIGTQTDPNGRFTLNAVPQGAVLIFAFIGYAPQEVPADKKNLLAINMQPANNSLSEVVVTTGLGVKQTNSDGEPPLYEAAQPAIGWSDFKKYLKDNAKSPDGKTGVVKVSFTVDQYGNLSGFKVIKSLGTETDIAAIHLIQSGSRWITNSDRKPEVVKVRIRFSKAQ